MHAWNYVLPDEDVICDLLLADTIQSYGTALRPLKSCSKLPFHTHVVLLVVQNCYHMAFGTTSCNEKEPKGGPSADCDYRNAGLSNSFFLDNSIRLLPELFKLINKSFRSSTGLFASLSIRTLSDNTLRPL